MMGVITTYEDCIWGSLPQNQALVEFDLSILSYLQVD